MRRRRASLRVHARGSLPGSRADHRGRREPRRDARASSAASWTRAAPDVAQAAVGAGSGRLRHRRPGGSARSGDAGGRSVRCQYGRPLRRRAVRAAAGAVPAGDQHTLVRQPGHRRAGCPRRPPDPRLIPACRGSDVEGRARHGTSRPRARVGSRPNAPRREKLLFSRTQGTTTAPVVLRAGWCTAAEC